MFGSVGMVELVILAGIALVVMGPEKFPDFARTVARMVRDARGYITEAQRDLEREIRPVKKELEELSKIDPESYIDSLAESAFKDEPQDDEYQPEPEGPTVDGSYQYGSVEAPSESEAQSDSPEPSVDAAEPDAGAAETGEPTEENPPDRNAD